jgi:transposase
MLDIVPAIIWVKRISRPKYGHGGCESAVVQAPAPPRPIDGGLPTAALLAHIAVSKFAWDLSHCTVRPRCWPVTASTSMVQRWSVGLPGG